MRASDKVLHDALTEAGLTDLAERAAKGEWNDYFGTHAMNINHLVAELKIVWATIERDAFAGQDHPGDVNAKIQPLAQLVHRAVAGDFDATKAEAEEWAKSDEGSQVFKDLVSGK